MRRLVLLLSIALALSACTVRSGSGLHAVDAPDPQAAEASTTSVATAPGERVRLRLSEAVRRLDVRKETRAGYDRDLFGDWIGQEPCGDTRDEVLRDESRVEVSDCDVSTGRWFSWYDGETWTDAEDVDIDHVVPLAEVWDSGAKGWVERRRVQYANDLGDPRTLLAVTDNVNQSKGDQDIREWQPDRGRCRYLTTYVAVKYRWDLAVDRPEKRAMRDRLDGCDDVRITVQVAR